LILKDHFTLLNGNVTFFAVLQVILMSLVYNAFLKYGKSSSWCKSHAVSFRTLSRAVSIRAQLQKYMNRFGMQLQSCGHDFSLLQKTLMLGYSHNIAQWVADGTYKGLYHKDVSLFLSLIVCNCLNFMFVDSSCPSNISIVYKKASNRLDCIS